MARQTSWISSFGTTTRACVPGSSSRYIHTERADGTRRALTRQFNACNMGPPETSSRLGPRMGASISSAHKQERKLCAAPGVRGCVPQSNMDCGMRGGSTAPARRGLPPKACGAGEFRTAHSAHAARHCAARRVALRDGLRALRESLPRKFVPAGTNYFCHEHKQEVETVYSFPHFLKVGGRAPDTFLRLSSHARSLHSLSITVGQ
jgi:hypothetical protein